MALNLSVIIPTRNRSELLARCLASLCPQSLSGKEFEIWVIDNGSIDGTASICDEFRERLLPNLNYHLEPTPGLHAARHAGLRMARGGDADILVFADDDIRAFPTWLEGVREGFEDQSVMLAGGKSLPDYECEPPAWLDGLWRRNRWGRWLGYLSLLDFGDAVSEIPAEFVSGCNFAVRKSVLLECGGFNPDGMPPELLRYRGDGESAVSWFVAGKGYRTVYNPKASVYHLVSEWRMTENYLKHRAYLQGISDSYTHIRRSRGMGFKDGFVAHIKQLGRRVKGLGSPVKTVLYKSYRQGYLFHREEVRRDRELLEWVLRENYLENGAV